MKLLHLSDTHFTSQVTDPELAEVLKAQVSLSEKLDWILEQEDINELEAVIVTGDLVHEGAASDYILLEKLLAEKFTHKPLYYTLGNHDNKSAFYQGVLGQSLNSPYHYSFVLNGYHFVMIDSSKRHSHKGMVDSQDLQQIQAELEKNELPKLVFQHHPIFGSEYFAGFVFEDPQPLLDLLASYPILGIFTGHTHSPAWHTQDGLVQYTNYAISFGLEKVSDKSQLFTNTNGYSVIEVNQENISVAPRLINPRYESYRRVDSQAMSDLNDSYEIYPEKPLIDKGEANETQL